MRFAWLAVLVAAACGPGRPAPLLLTPVPFAGPRDKVDLLFMIDNTVGPAVSELKARFPEVIKIIETGRQSYHIGVVTSDLGAGPFTLGGGQCHPDGDGGKLKAVGAAADVTCQPPTGGVRFIEYDQIAGTNNLPAGQDFATTFGCMASVGSAGCGFEQPLESVYRALHDPPPENAGFLRDDARLIVFFLTDEDDCSMPADSDVPDPNKTEYGPLLSYRCTHLGVSCNGMLMPNAAAGPFDDCRGATADEGGKLIDVQKYIDFFTRPKALGGLKDSPSDVVLATISAPDAPVESLMASPSPNPPGPYTQCAGPVNGMTCAIVLEHSCIAPQNTQFFGDPAVRLRQVVKATAYHQATSLCDTSYQSAMQSLGSLAVSVPQIDCLPRAPLDAAQPTCDVRDADGTPLPWHLEAQPACISGYQLLIDAPYTTVQAACALVAP